MNDDGTIKFGDMVIVRMHDEKSTSMLRVLGEQKVGKTKVYTKELIGQPYGSIFQICDRRLKRVEDDKFFDTDVEIEGIENASIPSDGKGDNRGYGDTNTAQKLDSNDIQRMRDSGASGADIIKSLIANSDTWDTKTEFAQEKWLKRKHKKYIRRMRIIKSSPATICEVYHNKSKDKVCCMRWDTLAQTLSQSGIRAGSRVLVFETLTGLLVGSVAYRLKGHGKIFAAFAGQQPHNEICSALNLDEKSISIIQTVPSEEIGPAARDVRENGFTVSETGTDTDNPAPAAIVSVPPGAVSPSDAMIAAAKTLNVNAGRDALKDLAKRFCSSSRQDDALAVVRKELRQGVDSLIIAVKFQPLPILQQCLSLLHPSSQFVVFSEFMEPLIECYLYLHENALAVRMVLSDTWMREYQTLPGRVHPAMYMSTSGGFLLTGVYVGMPESATIFATPASAAGVPAAVTGSVTESSDHQTDQDLEPAGTSISHAAAASGSSTSGSGSVSSAGGAKEESVGDGDNQASKKARV